MKTKLIYTLAAALVALAPAVKANWNNQPSATAIAIAVSNDDDDRDKDRKERAEAKTEMEEDLYDSANDSLDDHDWRRAAVKFQKVAQASGVPRDNH